jgi:PadR family transcriptional regulator PadR
MIKYINLAVITLPMEVKVTNMVKFYTLLLLNSRPMHGYEIIKEIGERLGRKISAGQIYPFLQSLEKRGYVQHGKPEEREKKRYHLTAGGKAFVVDMMAKFGSVIDAVIESKVNACVHCGAKIYGIGHAEKISGKRLLFCCSYCAASYKSGKRHVHKQAHKHYAHKH